MIYNQAQNEVLYGCIDYNWNAMKVNNEYDLLKYISLKAFYDD